MSSRGVEPGLEGVRVAKPLDVGNGLVAASFSADGAWLSIGRPHPTHGFVELSGLPAFDERCRGNPDAVRRYRRWMTETWSGFLQWELPGEASATAVRLDSADRPFWTRTGPDWSAVTTVSMSPGRPAIAQRLRLRSRGRGTRVTVRLSGHLARCAFAEITEVDPPPVAPTQSSLRLDGARLRIDAPGLPAAAVVTVAASPKIPCAWTSGAAGVWLTIDPPTGGELELTVTVELLVGDETDEPDLSAAARAATPRPAARAATTRGTAQDAAGEPAAEDVLDVITRGAVRYVLDCTALSVGEHERVLLTDHRLLPLSWTRDAYYQASLLLVARPEAESGRRTVAEHLRWLWGPGRPEDGLWQRSHFPHGLPKDFAVQADQQLYPLLELLDYRQACGEWPTPPGEPVRDCGRAWGALVADAWRRLPRGGVDGLLVSDENPADDPVELPYALSAQILYWHTATRLARHAAELALDPDRFSATADALPGAVARHFAVVGPYGPQWAYESDGGSDRKLYQDANDLPTALAPALGFCAPDDERWRATMRYAFSPHNPAYAAGAYGGLGSAHTPGAWTLGDAQELAVARATRDSDRRAAVIGRLARVAGIDGLLPETYCPETGEWLARHWFAWPAAAIGAICRGGIRHAA